MFNDLNSLYRLTKSNIKVASKIAAKAYFEAGIGTLIVMHMPEDVLDAIREQNIGNIIVAGHMASDSVGINKLIAKWEEEGIEVIRCSGVVDPTIKKF